MNYADVGKTNPLQLQDIRDWGNSAEWARFQLKYDPLLRQCCRRFKLDDMASDEVCQETWIEVANRMESFVYDKNQRFRGWLWRLCYYKAIAFLRKRKADLVFSLDERDEPLDVAKAMMIVDSIEGEGPGREDDEEPDLSLAGWQRQVEEIQTAVKQKVEPRTWEAFWLVDIAFWSVDETVEHLGMSHAAVYAAKERMKRRLRDEGRKRDQFRDDA